MRQAQIPKIDIWASWLTAAVIALVPFHAFLTVWASTLVGHFTVLRLWDEAALGVLVLYSLWCVVKDSSLRQQLWVNRIARLVSLYVLLAVLLGVVALLRHEVVLKAFAYALIINLRFLVWLLVVWIVCKRSDWLPRHWMPVVFIPLAAVVGFGLLQFFVLPHNFLKHFGYNDTTSYVATVTLNENSSTMRIQSFLRGANPLGAYLAVMLGLLLAWLSRLKRGWKIWLGAVLTAAALFLTFSRSAWIGTLVSATLVGWYRFRRHVKLFVSCIILVVALATAAIFALQGSGGVQNALFHHNGHSTAKVTSNQGHTGALRGSIHALSEQPFGDGPGTAGQASQYNSGHVVRNTESFWFAVALELGWPGLILLLSIVLLVAHELWLRRAAGLALGLLATLVGLLAINFLAYGWTDDTLAFVWWGLAAIVLARPVERQHEI